MQNRPLTPLRLYMPGTEKFAPGGERQGVRAWRERDATEQERSPRMGLPGVREKEGFCHAKFLSI
jgi:hypothetical protein